MKSEGLSKFQWIETMFWFCDESIYYFDSNDYILRPYCLRIYSLYQASTFWSYACVTYFLLHISISKQMAHTRTKYTIHICVSVCYSINFYFSSERNGLENFKVYLPKGRLEYKLIWQPDAVLPCNFHCDPINYILQWFLILPFVFSWCYFHRWLSLKIELKWTFEFPAHAVQVSFKICKYKRH